MAEGRGDGEAEGFDDDLVTLRPGLNIGRYRIVAVLGQGGFGITYRAVDSELGRGVAIKEYLPTALAVRKDGVTVVPRSRTAAEDLAWGLDRFVEEGRTLAALHRAPGIVKVHDYLRANGTAYLVMELVEGETLHDRIARMGPLDAAAIGRILAPLLDGLEEVHAAGFLHRDIKPANILIDREGRPTLIDFGASRAAIAGRSQALTAVFTPGYAPVEQFTSGTQGPWTDIYSLAASLYHAITGSPPANAIDRLLQDAYVPLALSGRAYPGDLLAGIDAGLAVRTADRPQSVAAWRGMLRGNASVTPAPATMKMSSTTSSAAKASAIQSSARDVSSRKPAARAKVAAAAAFALVLAAAGGFGLVSRTAAVPPASAPPSDAPPSSSVAAVQVPPAQDRAEQELEQARREQRMATDEAARLRAEAEARRRADEEAALRARIEQEVREKAAAEEAARRQAAEDARSRADVQAAADAEAKVKAEAEAKARADAEAAARLQAEEADRKGAEAAESALRLTAADRQHIQVALAALGHATGSTDGVFGPRSREMIAEWQKKTGRAATGFLTKDQQAALMREAAPAVARYDEEQKKQLAQAQSAGQAAARLCEGTFRSQWCRAAYQGFPPNCWNASMTIRNGEVSDSWVSQADRTQRNVVSGRIDGSGNVSLTYDGVGQQTHVNQRFTAIMSGKVVNGVLTAAGRAGAAGREFSVTVTCK
ncbi:protein kinase domain-containing protein [Reyranella sp.]|uniref:protein kinase domain-containing protein n=1 Tax=Reyranella sp. TaxID=1929291 RepID=UPI00378462B4